MWKNCIDNGIRGFHFTFNMSHSTFIIVQPFVINYYGLFISSSVLEKPLFIIHFTLLILIIIFTRRDGWVWECLKSQFRSSDFLPAFCKKLYREWREDTKCLKFFVWKFELLAFDFRVLNPRFWYLSRTHLLHSSPNELFITTLHCSKKKKIKHFRL